MVPIRLQCFITFLVCWNQAGALLNGSQLLESFKPGVPNTPEDSVLCNLSQTLVNEIKSYEKVSQDIIAQFLKGPLKGKSYRELEDLVDKFGPRFSGTPALENAIDFMKDKMEKINLQNVHGEEVPLPQWVRGYENAEMILPRRKKISILGLGPSIGTPHGGLEAEVLVVKDFDELRNRSSEVNGKIVVFNSQFINYATTSPFRTKGASEAAKLGAIASLTRSVGPLSLYTPHTGSVDYPNNVKQIPAACITIEDADLLQRLQDKGERIVIFMNMNDYVLTPVISRNLIGEIVGLEENEVVLISGHLDSWDVGQGAMDDGGGVVITLLAMELLNSLNIKPRRTLRAILWTGEEIGLLGAKEYAKRHSHNLQNISVLMESDAATFRPLGLGFSGSDEGACIIKEIANQLLAPINATSFQKFSKISSDVDVFTPLGVPAISLRTDLTKRYWYHHTEADTLTVEDSDELDLCAAAWTVTAFVLADMSVPIPRDTSTV